MSEATYTVSLSKNGPMVIVKADSVSEMVSALKELKESSVPARIPELQAQMYPQAPKAPLTFQ